MPEKCVVFGCSNVRSKEKGILLHPIPFYGKSESEKQKRRKKWVDFVKSKRAHWEPTEHSAVCSEHFKEEDYTNRFADDLVRRLKRDPLGDRQHMPRACLPHRWPQSPSLANLPFLKLPYLNRRTE